jgi:SPP1 gp7 family putative phage head morphogenesis protein
MTPAQAFAALRRLSPEQALEFLRSRALITQTWSWADLRADEFAVQFTVSRLAAVDVLADLQDLIIRSVGGDLTRADFARDAKSLLQTRGWWGEKEVTDPATGEVVTTQFTPQRLTLIYDTNVRQAHAAGQWERAQSTKRLFPFLRYVTQNDERVRSSHAAWHNLVLPVDDPFWDTHTPQNAYRCRCYVRQVSQADYERGSTPTGQRMNKNRPVEKMREWENPRTGEVISVPEGVHPAFAGNPGKDRLSGLQKLEADKLSRLRDKKGTT